MRKREREREGEGEGEGEGERERECGVQVRITQITYVSRERVQCAGTYNTRI